MFLNEDKVKTVNVIDGMYFHRKCQSQCCKSSLHSVEMKPQKYSMYQVPCLGLRYCILLFQLFHVAILKYDLMPNAHIEIIVF